MYVLVEQVFVTRLTVVLLFFDEDGVGGSESPVLLERDCLLGQLEGIVHL